MEPKERENTKTRPIRANTGKGVESLEMNFVGNKYDTQFIHTRDKKEYFMCAMHKLVVDVTLTHMTAKEVVKNHGEREIYSMYKE